MKSEESSGLEGELTSAGQRTLRLQALVGGFFGLLISFAGVVFVCLGFFHRIIMPNYFGYLGVVMILTGKLLAWAVLRHLSRKVVAFKWDDGQLIYRCFASGRERSFAASDITSIDPWLAGNETSFVIYLHPKGCLTLDRSLLSQSGRLEQILLAAWNTSRCLERPREPEEFWKNGQRSTLRTGWHCLNRHGGLAFLGLLAGIACFFNGVGGFILSHELPYLFDGVSTRATVIQKGAQAAQIVPMRAGFGIFAHGGGRRRPRCLIAYEFVTMDGRVQRGQARMDLEKANRLDIGDHVEIEYRKSAPEQNRLKVESGGLIGLGGVFAALGLLFGGGLILQTRQVFRRAVQELQLFQEGIPVWGRIRRINVRRSRKNRTHWEIIYEYSPQAWRGTKEIQGGTTEWYGIGPPRFHPGDSVLILHDPLAVDRHIADVYGLITA